MIADAHSSRNHFLWILNSIDPSVVLFLSLLPSEIQLHFEEVNKSRLALRALAPRIKCESLVPSKEKQYFHCPSIRIGEKKRHGSIELMKHENSRIYWAEEYPPQRTLRLSYAMHNSEIFVLILWKFWSSGDDIFAKTFRPTWGRELLFEWNIYCFHTLRKGGGRIGGGRL